MTLATTSVGHGNTQHMVDRENNQLPVVVYDRMDLITRGGFPRRTFQVYASSNHLRQTCPAVADKFSGLVSDYFGVSGAVLLRNRATPFHGAATMPPIRSRQHCPDVRLAHGTPGFSIDPARSYPRASLDDRLALASGLHFSGRLVRTLREIRLAASRRTLRVVSWVTLKTTERFVP